LKEVNLSDLSYSGYILNESSLVDPSKVKVVRLSVRRPWHNNEKMHRCRMKLFRSKNPTHVLYEWVRTGFVTSEQFTELNRVATSAEASNKLAALFED